MNSLIPVSAAIVAFIFGYRFYSKLLARGVFRLGKDYSTPEATHPTVGEYNAANRHLVFGQHLASLAPGIAVAACIVSLIWGWVPAFLWVVVGTVVAAGTYGLGSIWMSMRFPGLTPAQIAARLLGSSAHLLYALSIFIVLVILNAVCVSLSAYLFTAFPTAVWSFWFIVIVAFFLGNFLRGREQIEIIPASLIALALSLMTIWLCAEWPLSLSGALRLESAEYYVPLNGVMAWIIILFVYGYKATRQPMWRMIRPRGYLTALLLAVLLLIFYAAIVIDHPDLVAPQIHVAAGLPDVLPWIFVTVTSGALAGFHLLIANGISARQLQRETDARYVGYGGAIALAMLALSAIVIGSIGFASSAEWSQHFHSWEEIKNLPKVLELYINGFAQLAAGLGLERRFAQSFAAVVMLSLLTASFEAGLRLQKQLLAGLAEQHPALAPRKEKTLVILAVLLSALLALYQGQDSSLRFWSALGLADQVLAVLGFCLLAIMLKRLRRPTMTVLLPGVFMLTVTVAALILQLIQWWSEDSWVLLCLGTILLALELGVSLLTANKWNATSTKLDTTP